MLKHIEHVYLFRLAKDLRKSGFSRQDVALALAQQVGPIASDAAMRAAVNGAFEV